MLMTPFPSALNSHNPLVFSAKPETAPESVGYTVTKLQCISNFKLRLESAREEPRLRSLLGHISVYDNVRTWYQENTKKGILDTVQTRDDAEEDDDQNELKTYLQHVPSFQDFQAAIEVQLATMAQVSATAQQLTVEEYESDSDADSDYDSHDGEDWDYDDDNTDAQSDESLTDHELMEGESMSGCSSPTSDIGFDEKLIDDKNTITNLWSARPTIPLVSMSVHF